MTAQQIIEAAMRKINVMHRGETVDATELADNLETLQMMLGSWVTDGLMIPYYTWDSFTLTAGTASYTIGATGDQSTLTRPDHIENAFIRDSGGYDHPVKIVHKEAYLNVKVKTISARPSILWYNPTVPNGTIYLYGTPNEAEDLHYTHLETLTEPTALATTMTIPRAYDAPVMWCLAEWLAPEYGRDVTPTVARQALMGRANIQSLNAVLRAKPATLDITKAAPTYDISEGGGDAIEGIILE